MKNYDFNKAKRLIESNKNELYEASLGMHEDWFWTAEVIYRDGVYERVLPDNADELYKEFTEKRKNGMSMFSDKIDDDGLRKINPEYEKYTESLLIGGIYGSSWATPTLCLRFKNGSEKMIPCCVGDSDESRVNYGLGCLSQPVQDNITPLSNVDMSQINDN